MGSTLSGVDGGGMFNSSPEALGYRTNNPITTGSILRDMYTGLYTLINRANWVIEGTEKLTDDDFVTNGRKAEVIGEAKAMRALGHFYLLRTFGQFYDIDSKYGVVINDKPAKIATPRPRNTVAETYTIILQDLDDAIVSAPDLREKYYANKTFAKGLKAKVLLYKGDYTQAASVAEEVINNPDADFELAETFEEIFEHTSTHILNSSESLFNVYSDLNEGIGNGNLWNGIYANTNTTFYAMAETGTVIIDAQTIRFDSTRIPFMKQGSPAFPHPALNGNIKFRQGAGNLNETVFHLRMAEMYLIYAEAAARSTSSVSPDALAALNAIRIRAGATSTGGNGFETYPATINYDEFLEAVRIEKIMELATEMGEEWYDLVRYDYADGFNTGFLVSDNLIKTTTVPSTDKFILPIPDASIIASKNVVSKNPSY